MLLWSDRHQTLSTFASKNFLQKWSVRRIIMFFKALRTEICLNHCFVLYLGRVGFVLLVFRSPELSYRFVILYVGGIWGFWGPLYSGWHFSLGFSFCQVSSKSFISRWSFGLSWSVFLNCNCLKQCHKKFEVLTLGSYSKHFLSQN